MKYKVSDNLRTTILSNMKSSSINTKFSSVTKLSNALRLRTRFTYAPETLAKAIYALLKEGVLYRNSEDKICLREVVLYRYTTNKICLREGAKKTTTTVIGCPSTADILKAAETSPQAKQTLKTLYPHLFTPVTTKELLSFEGGTTDSGFPEELRKFTRHHKGAVTIYTAKGIAPTSSLEMKSIAFFGSDIQLNGSSIDVVVYDKNGTEVFRAAKGDALFVAFEKTTTK